MSITNKITKPLGQGYVQVDSENKGRYTRYYKVPERSAHVFSEELKAQEKRLGTYSNIMYFMSILVGVLGASCFTKNLNGWMKKFLVQCSGAIGLSLITMMGMNEYIKNEEKALNDKFHAKEIYYRA
jgi:hypothetical protein